MSEVLRIAMIQTHLHWENPDANLNHFEEKISRINQAVDVIILPEMFTTGFTMNPAGVTESGNSKTVKWLSLMAARTGALMLGSSIVKDQKKYFNRLFWVEPGGQILTYDKHHLFRMGNEHLVYDAGKKLLISTWRGWRICPLICYDLRFPVWSRNRYTETNGLTYDLLIYVANWPAVRNAAWETLIRARAIENLTFVAAVNRIGQDGKQIDHIGNSAVIGPQGDIMLSLASDDAVGITEMRRSDLKSYRDRFPAYLDSDPFDLDADFQ
jgi:omega-amidase